MRNCREVTQLISDGLDRPLPWTQRLAVRMHVLMCGSCNAYRRQLHAIHHAIGRARQQGRLLLQQQGHRLSDDARQRIKQCLRQ